MKKLSIIALVISIVALLLVVWIWTDGFGSAGTYIGRVTNEPLGGGTGKGNTTGQDLTGSQVVTGTTTTTPTSTSQVVLNEIGSSQTITVKDKSGTELFRTIIIPVGYTSGTQTILSGLRVTKIEATSAAQTLLTNIESLRKSIVLVTGSAFTTYVSQVADLGKQSIDVEGLKTELQKVLKKTSADAEGNSSIHIVITDAGTVLPTLTMFPLVIDQSTSITGTTNKDAASDFARTLYHVISAE